MLNAVPPLLTPDALHALASMDRGDEGAIGDANFPAVRLAQAGEKSAKTLDRFAFYAQAQAAFVILQTGEQRKYGNSLLRKGVISSDAS